MVNFLKRIWIVLTVLSVLNISCQDKKPETIITSSDSLAIYNKIRLDKEVSTILNSDEEEPDSLKYVYIDKGHCLHINRNCVALYENDLLLSSPDEISELSLISSKYALHRISRNDPAILHVRYFCRYCVDDQVYEQLINSEQEY